MKIALIWIFWFALVLWWLSPEVSSIKERVEEHNAQIERTINE
jgi:hypothetical protein